MNETPDPLLGIYNDAMPRRRLQKGRLEKRGNWWRFRWYEDVRQADGTIKQTRPSSVIGPATGPGRLSQKEALKKAQEDILAPMNAKAFVPKSLMSLQQFITQRFEPEVVWTMKHSGKTHYAYCFSKLIPALGAIPVRDLNVETIQPFIRRMLDEPHPTKPGKKRYKVQTAEHMKNALSAIIEHAKHVQFFSGDNPARLIKLPERDRVKKPALSAEKAQAVLARLDEPVRSAAMMSMLTGVNNAEVAGLTWKFVNLSEKSIIVETDKGSIIIGPLSFGIFENWYRGHRGSTKTTNRNRIQPIPAALVESLELIRANGPFNGPDDPVFASSNGTPIDIHNINKRHLKKIGKEIGVPGLSWQSFRRTAATLTGLTKMPKADRIALMGHASGDMTDYYSDSDIERRREYLDEIGGQLVPVKAEPPAPPENFTRNTLEYVKELDELNKLWEKE